MYVGYAATRTTTSTPSPVRSLALRGRLRRRRRQDARVAGGDVFNRDSSAATSRCRSPPAPGTLQLHLAPAAAAASLHRHGGTLSASAIRGRHHRLELHGRRHLDTAPLIDGSLVIEGSSSGNVYASTRRRLDRMVGAAGASIAPPNEQNTVSLTGLALAENTLSSRPGAGSSRTPAPTSAAASRPTPARRPFRHARRGRRRRRRRRLDRAPDRLHLPVGALRREASRAATSAAR